MKKYQVLGHDNNSLAMFLDTMHALHGTSVRAEIVSVIPVHTFRGHDIPFRVDGIETVELHVEEWVRKTDHDLILGSMVAKIKRRLFDVFHAKHQIAAEDYNQLIHPTAILARMVTMSSGVSIGPGSVVAPYAKLGHLVSVNRNVSVGHHVILEDFATLNPGCNIAAFCVIGNGATIGIGASLIDGVRIGENTTIGAGSVVTRNIPPNCVAYGVPASVVRDKVVRDKEES